MWPSEEEFLRQMKVEEPEEGYNALSQGQTVQEYQKKMENYEYWKRHYRMFTEKRHKCLRVPEHLKQEFRQAMSKTESQFSKYYDQYYQNRGFCVVTFSSRTMA